MSYLLDNALDNERLADCLRNDEAMRASERPARLTVTKAGIAIGSAYIPPPAQPGVCAEQIQAALLAKPDPKRLADAVVGWTVAVGIVAAVLAAMFS